MLRQVGAALELGQDEEEAHQPPELGAARCAVDLVPDEELDLGRELVDPLVALDHLLAEGEVAVEEGHRGLGQRLRDEGEQLGDPAVDLLLRLPRRHGG